MQDVRGELVKCRNRLYSQLYGELHVQTNGLLWEQLWNQLRGALLVQLWLQVRGALIRDNEEGE